MVLLLIGAKIMARLRYISPDEPGYSRKKWGRGFTYRDLNGETIRDAELRAWIESIAIPPAWTDVWIGPYKNGHILATGRDDKGRKQYRYHPEWRQLRDQKKFNALAEFGQTLRLLREVTDKHLRQRKISRNRVLAAAVRLLEHTLMRVGNEEYARKNDSYGLSTLTDEHAEIQGSTIHFEFAGKSGKEHTITYRDKRLARIVKQCQDIPGYELFQYRDETGAYQVIDSADINDYLHKITGKPFTAKVFRTWGGSTMAIKYLCEHEDEGEPQTILNRSIAYVAQHLGNTEAVTKDYYIHPAIMDAYRDGTLCADYADQLSEQQSSYDLSPEERILVALIEQSET